MKTASEFMSVLFEIEINAHIAHLQTTSYAQHMALGTLYEDIVELRDRFAEGWQGTNGSIIKGYKSSIPVMEGMDMSKYLRGHLVNIILFRNTLKEGFLQQIVDDVAELINSSLYKLQTLR